MRRTHTLALLLVMLAACGATPIQREMQYAIAIKTVQTQTVAALDFGILDADAGAAIQVGTRTATDTLKKAVAARRDGLPNAVGDALLDAVLSALLNVQGLLASGGK